MNETIKAIREGVTEGNEDNLLTMRLLRSEPSDIWDGIDLHSPDTSTSNISSWYFLLEFQSTLSKFHDPSMQIAAGRRDNHI
jgi:hypothetical protein